MDAAIYTRLSRDRGDDTPLLRQDEDARRWAAEHGLAVETTFTDVISGYRADAHRPEFEAAIEWATSGKGRTIIVWKLDRLSRRGIGQVGLVLDRLEAVGSRVVFLQDALDSSIENNRMVIAIMAEQARQESHNTSIRSKAGLRSRRLSARWVGGAPPYGWRLACQTLPSNRKPEHFIVAPDVEPGRLVLDPETAPHVQEAVSRIIEGDSLNSIASDFVARGIPTARGGRWHAATVRSILASPVLVGLMPLKKESAEPYRHPDTGKTLSVAEPLISHAERRRLLAALAARSRVRPGRKPGRAPGSLLGGGLLTCSECGGWLKSVGQAYTCQVLGFRPVSVHRAKADEWITWQVTHEAALLDPSDPRFAAFAKALLGEAAPDLGASAEREAALAEQAEAEATLRDLRELRYGPSFRQVFPEDDAETQWAALLDQASARYHAAEAEVEHLAVLTAEPDVGILLDPASIRDEWERTALRHRRAAIEALVERIVVHPAKARGRFVPEDRFAVSWRAPGALPMG
jgi:site-specific DNA recombinase